MRASDFITEKKSDPCWSGYKAVGTKKKGKRSVPNCVPVTEQFTELEIAIMEGGHQLERSYLEETYHGNDFYESYGVLWYNQDERIDEAEYQGRQVTLGKPMRDDVKKFKVYVKNPEGRVVKVNFGDPDMKIKKSDPARRKSFRARHRCDNTGPRHKARYWSCKMW